MASENIVSGMAGRYATALFELAESERSLDAVAADLNAIQAMIDGSVDLRQVVLSPVFGADDQAKAFAAILDRAGIKGLVANFVGLVIEKRRLFALPAMIAGYRQLLAKSRGEVSADVTSAHALSDAQLASIKAALKAATGRDVLVNTRVDEGLLGGLVVKVGSRMIDSSLKTKLNSLKLAMKEAS
ncbi:F0F1 ATP synthase subunit delta [Parvibaculum sp.]|uniref:F0F1 ATP synthase subunit delta n=1 Tax=Parvibaculum sp. TaxID=2024848 RepID=UPI002BF4AC21|nr:F0F1 ATP synthase subunit delta [Parvibaculum sp.]HUD53044.1 F0F1 ATP synthase subunit delta [Parvibaculum sp.]